MPFSLMKVTNWAYGRLIGTLSPYLSNSVDHVENLNYFPANCMTCGKKTFLLVRYNKIYKMHKLPHMAAKSVSWTDEAEVAGSNLQQPLSYHCCHHWFYHVTESHFTFFKSPHNLSMEVSNWSWKKVMQQRVYFVWLLWEKESLHEE